MRRAGWCAVLVAACGWLATARAADEPAQVERDKQALSAAGAFVGQWRGVAQPKRGSDEGAWIETSEWVWRFPQGRAVLECTLADDKYYSRWEIKRGDKPEELVLHATRATKGQVTTGGKDEPPPVEFRGQKDGEALVLTAASAAADEPARLTLRLVAGGDRLLALYEQRTGENVYSRLAEVGSTRQGSSFAKASIGGPECIVTGGLGTIAVTHQGQTYYVCCTGCRDMFNDDPATVLKDFQARKEAEKVEKK